MKLKRFVAPDMKTALGMIKEELGADAIIMSNKRVETGVEIVAGVENNLETSSIPKVAPKPAISRTKEILSLEDRFNLSDDEVILSSKATHNPNSNNKVKNVSNESLNSNQAANLKTTVAKQEATTTEDGASSISQSQSFAKSLIEILERQQQNGTLPKSKSASTSMPAKHKAPSALIDNDDFKALFEKSKEKLEKEAVEEKSGINTYNVDDDNTELKEVKSEIALIRRLLQFELAGLLQENKSREEPVRAMVSKLLHSAGFSKAVSELLTKSVDTDASFNFAWREVSDKLTACLNIGDDEIINDGGIVTLIGPAGVGKTTTLAKLAARFVMKYGADRVAIITSDNYRIGAVDQIKTYGRIMGCACLAIKSFNELPQMLFSLKDKSLVLVDTAGVGLKDERFGTQIAQLKLQSALKLKHYLVLPATAQRRVLEQVYKHFKDVGLCGLILTKVDESLSLGDALSLCIEKGLKISYVTNGQRVPEDLSVPDRRAIAIQALSSVEDEAVSLAIR